MGGLSLRQHTQFHGVVIVGGIVGLFVRRGGPLLLGNVAVVSRVADVRFIEGLRIAHLANPVSAMGRV